MNLIPNIIIRVGEGSGVDEEVVDPLVTRKDRSVNISYSRTGKLPKIAFETNNKSEENGEVSGIQIKENLPSGSVLNGYEVKVPSNYTDLKVDTDVTFVTMPKGNLIGNSLYNFHSFA